MLRGYLASESQDKKKVEFDFTGWTLDYTPRSNTPNQENGYDCGVFTCIFAEHLSRQADLDFDQSIMTYCRQRLANEIEQVKMRVLPPPE